MICSRRMLAISFLMILVISQSIECRCATWWNANSSWFLQMKPEQTQKQTIVSRFSLTLADSLQLFFKKEMNRWMDGCCLLNIKWSSAVMIDFELDPLMTLFFYHFLREFVCCLYKVVRNRKAEPISFFDLVAAVKKPQNAFASCRVLLRPSGLISFAFFSTPGGMNHLLWDAIGFSSSSRCFQLALINELPVRPSVRWCGIKQQNRGGSFSFRVFVFAIFGILLFLRVRMRCISTSMNVTPSNFLSSDDCRARNFCRLPNRDGRWRPSLAERSHWKSRNG